jgi:hypothetical protein
MAEYGRVGTYADEHARTVQVVFARTEPRDLRDLVRQLRRAYELDMPSRMHKHAVDGGGTPAYAPQFAAHLYGSPMAIDNGEDARAVYRTPCRAALARATGTHKVIVHAVVVAGDGPVDAALAAGIPADVAKLTAEAVLRRFWRMMSSGPLPPSTMTT